MARALVVAIGAILLAAVVPAAPAASAPERSLWTPSALVAPDLHACRYDDVPTRFAGQDDWRITSMDTIYRVSSRYVPDALVSTARAGMTAGYTVRPEVIDDLRAMHRESRRDGAEIAVRWAYRTYRQQAGVFAHWARIEGEEVARTISARPGHSEHQLGSALDFRSADSTRAPWEYDDWGRTPAGTWMRENSWRFGFVLSYPKGRERETCYAYEPWHVRYVGRDIAAAVHESGMTLREYLWRTFESAPRTPAEGCCYLSIY